jgi:hypothetical protein
MLAGDPPTPTTGKTFSFCINPVRITAVRRI